MSSLPAVVHSDEGKSDELRAELARAAEQRTDSVQRESKAEELKRLAREHDIKQSFRRLLDPGIMRPNNREHAFEALKTLAMISDNLLREPDNAKFQQFKPTNNAIKKRLVDVKGALEYAVALGFHLQAESFQPVYKFNERHREDLRLGNEVIKETLDRETAKLDREKHAKEREQQAREEAARNVKLQYHDDRRTKALRDQLEAEARAAAAANPHVHPSSPTIPRIPTGGITLSGNVEPPEEQSSTVRRVPYEDDEDEL